MIIVQTSVPKRKIPQSVNIWRAVAIDPPPIWFHDVHVEQELEISIRCNKLSPVETQQCLLVQFEPFLHLEFTGVLFQIVLLLEG